MFHPVPSPLAGPAAKVETAGRRRPKGAAGTAGVEVLEARITPATFVWDGGGHGGSWADPANWVGDVAPVAGSDLVFTGAGTVTVNDFGAAIPFNSLTIQQTGFTLSGDSIELSGGVVAAYGHGTATIALNLSLASPQTIHVNPGASLSLAGEIDAGQTLTLDVSGSVNVSGGITGVGGVIKKGLGSLVMTGDNSYTGATTLLPLGGKLSVQGTGDIAQSASITVGVGSVLILDDSGATGVNRIGDSVPLTLAGGELSHIGNMTNPAAEHVGSINVIVPTVDSRGDMSVIRSVWNGAPVQLTAGKLIRGVGGTAKFIAEGANLGGSANQIRFTGTVANVTNDTLGWAVLYPANGGALEFVAHNSVHGICAAPFVTSIAAAGPGDNVKLSASESLPGNKAVNAVMVMGNGVTISSNFPMHVASGLVANASGTNTISAPLRFTGQDVIYAVEDGSKLTLTGSQSMATSEAQSIEIGAGVSSFTLTFPSVSGLGVGGTTLPIAAAGVDAAAIQSALQAIAPLAGNVVVKGEAGGPYTVSFTNALAGLNLPSLSAFTTNSTTGDTTVKIAELQRGGPASAPVGEQQTVAFGVGVTSVAFEFNGVAGSVLAHPFATTAGALQANLNGIPALQGNVQVAGPAGGPYVVKFVNGLANQDVSLLKINSATDGVVTVNETAGGGLGTFTSSATARKILGGTLVLAGDNTDLTVPLSIDQGLVSVQHSAALGHRSEVVTLVLGGDLRGSYTLTINGRTTIAADGVSTTATMLQSSLEALQPIGAGNVRVEQFGNSSFRIRFIGELDDQNLPTITANVAGGISAEVSTVRNGQSGGTTVRTGASIQIEGNVAIGNESLVLYGSGVGGSGALRSSGGTSSWGKDLSATLVPSSTGISLGSDAVIAVESGQLTLDAAISGSASLTKVGAGALEFAGAQGNSYIGATRVNDGQLNLNKRGGSMDSAVLGSLVIGDSGSSSDASRVVLVAPDQIANTAWVSIGSSGQLISNGATADEVQTVSFIASAGTFSLTFAGQTTSSLPFNASAAIVQAALEKLGNVGLGNINVSGTAGSYSVSFKGSLASASLPQMSVSSSLTLVGETVGVHVDTVEQGVGNEVQVINIASSSINGSFTLRFAGSSATSNVPIGVNVPGTIEGVLSDLSNVGAGNVRVLGPSNFGITGGTYYVIFRGSLSGANLPQLVTAPGTLVNGGPQFPPVAVTASTLAEGAGNEVQSLLLGAGLGATYSLQFGGQSTTSLASSSDAAAVQAALEALPNIGAGNVRVVSGATGAGTYHVIFTGALANTDVAPISTASAGVTPSTVRDGGSEKIGGLSVSNGLVSIPDGKSLSIDYAHLDTGTISGPGVLNLGGNVSVNDNPPSLISASINLLGGDRIFDISQGQGVVDLLISGVISNGAVTKARDGMLSLTGANTYEGGTVISSGPLSVANTSGSGTGAGAVSVLAGATLSGTGTVAGAVTVASGGIIAPGVGGVGVLTIGSLLESGEFRVVVNGADPGQHGQLNVIGTTDLHGATLNLSGNISTVLGGIVLLDNRGADPYEGVFLNLKEGDPITVNGLPFVLTYRGGDGNDLALVSTATITLAAPSGVVSETVTHGAFHIHMSQPSAVDTVVTYQVTGGTATVGEDFSPFSGVVTIPAGQTSAAIDISVLDDSVVESLETIEISLTGIAAGNSNGRIVRQGEAATVAAGAIEDDDVADWTLGGDLHVSEGATASYVLKLRGVLAVGQTAAIDLSLADRTTNPSDHSDLAAALATAILGRPEYSLAGTTLTVSGTGIAIADLNFSIATMSDSHYEGDEAFAIAIGNPRSTTGVAAIGGGAVATVVHDTTPMPVLSISDASVIEGDFGTVHMIFEVSLVGDVAIPVTVFYSTANGTAISPGDFIGVRSSSVTFSPGETSKTISIPVVGDTLHEGGVDEEFRVLLGSPVHATIARGEAVGTILNDDAAPAATHHVDARHPFVFFDANHDQVTVKLSGPGSAVVLLNGGVETGADISAIDLTGTTAKSALSILVRKDKPTGDGVVTVGEITASGPLKALSAAKADLVAGGFRSADAVASLTFHDLVRGEIVTGGKVSDQLSIRLGKVADGTAIETIGKVLSLSATSIGSATVSGPAFGSISTVAGGIAAEITSSGAIGKLRTKGGSFSGAATAESFGSVAISGGDFRGSLTSLTSAADLGKTLALKSLVVSEGDLEGDVRVLGRIGAIAVNGKRTGGNVRESSIVAAQIVSITVGRDFASSVVLAGADLGEDGAVGGGDDAYGAGILGTVKIRGAVTGVSVIGAGADFGVDHAVRGNDDGIVGGVASYVKSLTIAGAAGPDSYFMAGLFKSPPKIAGKVVALSDPRFKTA